MTRILVTSSVPKIKYVPSVPNSANYNNQAVWNGGPNITTVGTNGGPSYYGTYDQTGNLSELVDRDSAVSQSTIFMSTGTFNVVSPVTVLSSNSTIASFNYLGFRFVSSNNFLNLSNLVNVGDINNIANTNPSVYVNNKGSVSYEYMIGKYLVTNNEYAEFLNAIALADYLGFNNIYDTNMSSSVNGGIIRSGSSGSYSYAVKTNMGNKPVNFVSWFDCARYCNWLHNGKPTGPQNSGTTEDGAYSLNGASFGNVIAKNVGAKYYLPTRDEWIKAGLYSPNKNNSGLPGYYLYATQRDAAPLAVTANTVGDGIIPSSIRQGPRVRI